MRTLLTIIFLAFTVNAQTHLIQGRITDLNGRGIRSHSLRVQANFCPPEYQFTPVYEYYGHTNSFGYYNIRPRGDCASYSIRPLDSRRVSGFDFHPLGYYFLYRDGDQYPRVLRPFNFALTQ